MGWNTGQTVACSNAMVSLRATFTASTPSPLNAAVGRMCEKRGREEESGKTPSPKEEGETLVNHVTKLCTPVTHLVPGPVRSGLALPPPHPSCSQPAVRGAEKDHAGNTPTPGGLRESSLKLE